jgi:hypothetical protein
VIIHFITTYKKQKKTKNYSRFKCSKTFESHGIPRNEYGIWLEEKVMKFLKYHTPTILQELYFKESRFKAVSEQFATKTTYTFYYKNYIYWLEELYLKQN